MDQILSKFTNPSKTAGTAGKGRFSMLNPEWNLEPFERGGDSFSYLKNLSPEQRTAFQGFMGEELERRIKTDRETQEGSMFSNIFGSILKAAPGIMLGGLAAPSLLNSLGQSVFGNAANPALAELGAINPALFGETLGSGGLLGIEGLGISGGQLLPSAGSGLSPLQAINSLGGIPGITSGATGGSASALENLIPSLQTGTSTGAGQVTQSLLDAGLSPDIVSAIHNATGLGGGMNSVLSTLIQKVPGLVDSFIAGGQAEDNADLLKQLMKRNDPEALLGMFEGSQASEDFQRILNNPESMSIFNSIMDRATRATNRNAAKGGFLPSEGNLPGGYADMLSRLIFENAGGYQTGILNSLPLTESANLITNSMSNQMGISGDLITQNNARAANNPLSVIFGGGGNTLVDQLASLFT